MKEVDPGLLLRSFEASPNPDLLVDLTDPQQPIVGVNAALEALLDMRRDELVGRPSASMLGPESGFAPFDFHTAFGCVAMCRAGRRDPFLCQLDARPVWNPEGEISHSICSLRELSALGHSPETFDQLVSYDPLSSLVVGRVFEERLTVELVRAIHDCSRVVVCHARVDRLAAIDELYDPGTAADLIRLIAERLADCAGNRGLASRTASGAFVVAFVGQDAAVDQLDVGQRVAMALVAPFRLGPAQRRVAASIGVSCFPDTASSARELMQQAAAAAYSAKRAGGNDVYAFTATRAGGLGRHLQLAHELDGAVERGEMTLVYQPVFSTISHKVVGMEALVRWRNPQRGLIMPDQFIPLAEDLGMINQIGHWVLNEACAQARRWLDQGAGDFSLSVNVSRVQMRGRKLLEDVRRALDASRLHPAFLDLELTETAIMANVEEAGWVMGELRKMGVQLSMDDFGMGQSSLAHLQRFPVNRMKIDRSFVSAVPDDVKAARICRAIIALAHEFGFAVVGEGVEKSVQLAFLERNGCEFVQGFLLGHAVAGDAMLGILREPKHYRREVADSSESGAILLVDDEQNVLRALARLLRRDGYRIFTASSFGDAFNILGNQRVQVVISDHRMPEGKGTEFLSRVKATHPNTVRLILSGYADVTAVTEAINGGAVYRFLTKPWADDDLRESVRDAMRVAQHAAADA